MERRTNSVKCARCDITVLEAVKGLCSEMAIFVNKFLELLGAWAIQSHLHQEAKLQNGRAAVLAPHGAFGSAALPLGEERGVPNHPGTVLSDSSDPSESF